MSAPSSTVVERLRSRCREALVGAYWLVSPAVRGRTSPPGSRDAVAVVPFAFEPSPRPRSDSTICVVCHLFHDELAPEMRAAVERIPFRVSTFISTDTAEKKARIEAVFRESSCAKIDVRVCPNRGRDIASKFVTFAEVYERNDYVLFVHGKRSATSDIGDAWRKALLSSLVGSTAIVESIVSMFERDPSLGVVMARNFPAIRRKLDWGHNFAIARSLATRMGFALTPRNVVEFPAGSMFWARTEALRPLLELGLRYEDFPVERGQVRGTPQHAIERLVLFACERAGFRWTKVTHEVESDRDEDTVRIHDEAALGEFLRAKRAPLIDSVGVRP